VEFTVGDELLGLCDQTFIKACRGLDGYEVVSASNLGRKVRHSENVLA
jgi:hypothetical protein